MLLGAEMGSQFGEVFIRRVGVADQGQAFSPAQRGAFAGVKNGVSRQAETVYRRRSVSPLAGVGGVHVEAEGAAVDL